MGKYLFDTSSVIKAIKDNMVEVLIDGYIQWLTIYEILNAFWKEVFLFKTLTMNDLSKIVKIIDRLLSLMKILGVRGLEKDVVNIALETGLTTYDASYIAVALNNNLVLVTEDKELFRKSRKYVKTLTISNLYNRSGDL